MIILVCGGRHFADAAFLNKALDKLNKKYGITRVVNGAQQGADTLSTQWAKANGIKFKEYPANWNQFGNGAGPIRNQEMLDKEKPTMIVSFRGGAGTADMCNRASKQGYKVIKPTIRFKSYK